MCYTTTTHFNRCSHRTSTINLCPRSIQYRPTIYHPPTRHARPCKTNSHEGDILVQRDGLCQACSRVSFWFEGGGGGGRLDDRTGRDGPRRRKDKTPSTARMAGGPPYHHPHATQRRAAPPGPAEPAYPVPTGSAGGARCPLSEAFERVTIGGDDDDARAEGSQWGSGGIGESAGVDGGGTRRQKREYGPFRPPRFSSDADKVGMSSWSGGYGGQRARKVRCASGKKHVRFAPKVEVLHFRRDWATKTLRSLSREYKGRR